MQKSDKIRSCCCCWADPTSPQTKGGDIAAHEKVLDNVVPRTTRKQVFIGAGKRIAVIAHEALRENARLQRGHITLDLDDAANLAPADAYYGQAPGVQLADRDASLLQGGLQGNLLLSVAISSAANSRLAAVLLFLDSHRRASHDSCPALQNVHLREQ